VVIGSREGRSPAATDRGTAEELQPAMSAAVPTSAVTVILAAAQPAGARPADPQRSVLRVAAGIAESAQAGLGPQWVRAGFGLNPSPHGARPRVAPAP
jgi:hypothetical protein